GKLAEQAFLILVELGRDADFDVHLQVASAVLAQVGDAFAAQADDSPALGAGGNFDGGVLTVQRGDSELVAQGGLGDVHGHFQQQVVALALEEAVRLNVQHHVQVACHAAAWCRLALTRQPNLKAFVGAGRDLNRHGLLGAHHAATLTLVARVSHDLALAAAAVAQGDIDELPEYRLLHTPDLATALAPWTLDRLRTGLHAVASAARASHVLGQRYLFSRAEDGLFQRQVDVVAQVLAALNSLASSTAAR